MLASELPSRIGLAVGGAVLVSPVLDFSTLQPGPARPLPWALSLPSLVATARSLDLVAGEAPTAEEVEAFALGDYLDALVQPALMTEAVPRTPRWTALHEDWVGPRPGRTAPPGKRRESPQEHT